MADLEKHRATVDAALRSGKIATQTDETLRLTEDREAQLALAIHSCVYADSSGGIHVNLNAARVSRLLHEAALALEMEGMTVAEAMDLVTAQVSTKGWPTKGRRAARVLRALRCDDIIDIAPVLRSQRGRNEVFDL